MLPVVEIAKLTGPLTVLQEHQVLLLADEENLTYGARHLGFEVDYRTLGEKLRLNTRCCSLHAFFSRSTGDEGRVEYLRACGWIPHPRDIQTVQTCRGTERLANSDALILFSAGLLVSRSDADLVVLASGDGDLVSELAQALAALPKTRRVATLSLAGSTSSRLNAAHNPLIHANIELGADCLQPARSSEGA
ncbi:MAG TPA: NYN domain-containing protein [Candidatus Acidoferrum sp.]